VNVSDVIALGKFDLLSVRRSLYEVVFAFCVGNYGQTSTDCSPDVSAIETIDVIRSDNYAGVASSSSISTNEYELQSDIHEQLRW
jgi:hypothetical protein